MLKSSLVLFIIITAITGILYPIGVTLVNQTIFSEKSNGSLITKNGKIIGSELLGQNFTDPKYFWGRPSETPEKPYNAAFSSGSNLALSNKVQKETVQKRISIYHLADPENKKPIPIDLVTASASGLDPHISLSGALYQARRIAKLRNISASELEKLILENEEPKFLGIIGERVVNVLKLNLELDKMSMTMSNEQ